MGNEHSPVLSTRPLFLDRCRLQVVERVLSLINILAVSLNRGLRDSKKDEGSCKCVVMYDCLNLIPLLLQIESPVNEGQTY